MQVAFCWRAIGSRTNREPTAASAVCGWQCSRGNITALPVSSEEEIKVPHSITAEHLVVFVIFRPLISNGGPSPERGALSGNGH